jgi:hypothetical protein
MGRTSSIWRQESASVFLLMRTIFLISVSRILSRHISPQPIGMAWNAAGVVA